MTDPDFDIEFKLEAADFVAFARGFIGDVLTMTADALDFVKDRLLDLAQKVDKL